MKLFRSFRTLHNCRITTRLERYFWPCMILCSRPDSLIPHVSTVAHLTWMSADRIALIVNNNTSQSMLTVLQIDTENQTLSIEYVSLPSYIWWSVLRQYDLTLHEGRWLGLTKPLNIYLAPWFVYLYQYGFNNEFWSWISKGWGWDQIWIIEIDGPWYNWLCRENALPGKRIYNLYHFRVWPSLLKMLI